MTSHFSFLEIPSMKDLDLNQKKVVIRVDLNVPLQEGAISNDERIQAILPTLQLALQKQAAIILLSHLGRPLEGEISQEFSLEPIAKRLEALLKHPVRFVKNWLEGGFEVKPQEIVLCENVRFNLGEKSNDPKLSKKMAALGDVFIMDAFGTAHRAEASTVGIARYAKTVGMGLLLERELNALSQVLENPKRPVVAIVGGAKVSTKLLILKNLIKIVDVLILGGGIANTFIAAQGREIGSSLFEPELVPIAKELMEEANRLGKQLLIPTDCVVTKKISNNAVTRIFSINGQSNSSNFLPEEKIVDVGPKTIQQYQTILQTAGTIIWNGPLGIFEYEPFEVGTRELAKAIAGSKAYSLAGGGETLSAIDKFGVKEQISYISTGGGAFLECLEGKVLPGVLALQGSQRFTG